MKWSIGQVWNKALETDKSWELRERDYIWASEIGGAPIDRYLKMKAVKQTNPPNARSLRKFEAGNIMEGIVSLILLRAGILKKTQEHINYQYPGLLKVTGRLDLLAGGKVDYAKGLEEVKKMQGDFPEQWAFFFTATSKIIEYLQAEYPAGLEEIIIEVKSCSSFMYDKYEKTGADLHHQLQLYHYLKGKNMPEGHIFYISRDDLRLLEFGVYNPSPIEAIYKADIEKMTGIYGKGVEPEKEPMVVYEEKTGKFSRNWKVAYSGYLTLLYGYESQMEYENAWTGKVGSWNRVMGRCVKGDRMTDKNLEIIKEAKEFFPNWDELVKTAKAKGLDPEAEVAEETE